ncbi:GyrI-like domain-containing protein [Paenibacillus sp. NPDC056933]|uniref:GyrI-like domain-containing protein n=1 Tax=Paenibacillus sp. NPDC056933 TaxID=3345968 RepID=UPI0036447151
MKVRLAKTRGVLGISVTAPDKDASRAMDYWVAAEYEGSLPGGWLKLEVPSFQWAVFEVHGTLPEAMHNMWKQIYSEGSPPAAICK